jgi:hypothetical protein
MNVVNDFNFKRIGKTDVSNIINKVKSLDDKEWKEYDFRQKTYDPHIDTLTIPLLFDENFSDYPNEYKLYSLFKEDLNSLKKIFLDYYKSGWITRAILVNLPAGKIILPHIDQDLGECYRYHIAIITNDKVNFMIGNQINNMKVGDIWKINNNKPHSVTNFGKKDRIHLILDWHI